MTAPAWRHAAHWQVLQACRPASWGTASGRWFAVGVVVLLVGAAALLAAWTGKAIVALLLSGIPLLSIAWGLLVHGLLAQNAVAAAVTVPRHVRVLREVLGAAWVGLLVLVAAVALGLGLDPVAAVLRHAVLLFALALVVRWPILWVGVGVVPWFALVQLDPVVAQLQTQAPAVRAGGVLALLVAGPAALAPLVGVGGPMHRRMNRQQETARRLLAGNAVGGGLLPGRPSSWLARVGRLMAWPYHRALRVASAPGSALSPTARLMFVLGPGVHPGVQAWWIAVLGVGVLAVFLPWGPVPPGWRPDDHVLWGPTLGVMSMALNPVFGVLAAWRNTRREQALVALLPGIERGGRLNQALARHMGRHFGLAWFGGSIVLAGFAAWGPAQAGSLAIVSAALLPLGGFLCTDLSRLPDRPSPHLGRVMAGFAGVPLVSLGLHHGAGVPAPVVVLLLLLGSAAWLTARYRALVQLPQALPCGRLA